MTVTTCYFNRCGAPAYFIITKNGQTITVCSDCRDYFLEEGWVLAGYSLRDMVRTAGEAKR